MYRKFYRLKEKPFELTPDPRFLFFSETHQEALARLLYGVNERKGFLLLTGDVGTGKTTMLQTLNLRLDNSTRRILICNPKLSVNDLYRKLYLDLGFSGFYRSKVKFLGDLQSVLKQIAAIGHNVLLIIDEAQALPLRLLEEIRLLTNLETHTQKLLNIFLVGQPELRQMLNGFRMRALSQRISIQYNIKPLGEKDTIAYVKSRLQIAGAQGATIFNHDALRVIHEYSRGYPRVINILCDNALISGFVKGTYTIGREIIRECAKDISINAKDNHIPEQYLWTPAGTRRCVDGRRFLPWFSGGTR